MTFEAVAVWEKRIANEILTNFQFKFTPLGRTKLPHPLFFLNSILINSSIIRQKGEYQTEVTRKQSTPNFPKNKHFLHPDTHMYVRVRNFRFFAKFGMFWFLVNSISRFAFLSYYPRIVFVLAISEYWEYMLGDNFPLIKTKGLSTFGKLW